MGLFSADEPQFLEYTIWLTDPVALAAAQATTRTVGGEPGRIVMAPDDAIVRYHAPYLSSPLPPPPSFPDPGAPFVAPCVTSNWFLQRFGYPRNVSHFVHSTGWWIFGYDVDYYWTATFKAAPAINPNGTGTVLAPDAPTALTKRRWIDGAELPILGEGGSGGPPVSRAASRHLGGMGYSFRDTSADRVHTPIENGAVGTAKMWERFYVRFRQWPTATSRLWRARNSGSPAAGAALDVLPNGALILLTIDNVGAAGILATTAPLTLNAWTRIDLLYEHASSLTDRWSLRLFVNGVWVLTQMVGGLSYGGTHGNSAIGGGPATGMCMDIDDWIGAEWPSDGSFLNPSTVGPLNPQRWMNHPGHDWNAGSRVELVSPTAFAASHNVAWSSDWAIARQRPVGSSPNQGSTTTIAGARFAVETDADLVATVPQLGIAALRVALYGGPTAAGASGTLGTNATSPAVPLTALPGGEVFNWKGLLGSAAPLVDPVASLEGLELYYEKGADAVLGGIEGLFGVVELLGTWGPEDAPPPLQEWEGGTTPPTAAVIDYPHLIDAGHNAPYPRTVWAQPGVAPPSPVYISAGTYVGNDLVTTLTFQAPVHFILVRALTGGNGLVTWFAAGNGPHVGTVMKSETDTITVAEIDPAAPTDGLQTIVKIPGTNIDSNAAGVTYQYLAFGDPGARFLLTGQLRNWTGGDFVNALANETFTPEAGFFQAEQIAIANNGALYKGLGHGAAGISWLHAAAEIASGLSWSNGTVTSKAALHAALVAGSPAQVAFALFRRSDGNHNPDEGRVLQLATYVGDGSASRTINLAPLTGRRPLFGLVVPHDAGGSVMRDPSHIGTGSTWIAGAAPNAGSGITAGGLDSLSVGSSMNTLGVAYEVFVFPGDSAAGSGGWSVNGDFFPVAPDSPTDGPWDPPPLHPEIPDTPGAPVIVVPPVGGGAPSTDFGTGCVAASTAVINIALAHLGVSKQIVNVLTDATQEATAARLHFTEDVAATLRDYPWPFATRYARLVWVAGTSAVPVNGDWQYSYVAPPACLFARRIVNPSGSRRGWDTTPIAFRVGGDDTLGTLIYTNIAPTEVNGLAPELEYTTRPLCAVLAGDAIFRAALAWRHAHSLAPTLSRDDKKVEFCWQMYRGLLMTAETKAAAEDQKDPSGDAPWIVDR